MSSDATEFKAPKRARGVLRVNALLDAAAAEFLDKGYDDATMTAIAARAGAAIGSLYQFFPSKTALAEALFNRYAERVAANLDATAAQANALSAADLAAALLDAILEFRAERDAALALSATLTGIMERRKPLRLTVRQKIATVLRTANPSLTEHDAATYALIITQIMKIAPVLAGEETTHGQPLVAELRKLLGLYLATIL